MIKYFFLLICIFSSLFSKNIDKTIGSTIIVGFDGVSAKKDSQICKDIKKYDLCGVILFDINLQDREKPKNIISKEQTIRLIKELKSCKKNGKLLVAIDEEGGVVQRLKKKYGFYGKYPSEKEVGKMPYQKAREIYLKMSKELKDVGINYNFAPVVDLAVNPKNIVIYKLKRSFGKDPKKVAKYARIFIDSMHKNGILTSLKHFPGHGSSMGDSHKGFVDVTNLWREKELKPYKILIKNSSLDSIMVAHIYNRNLDPRYPATLSKLTIKDLLRNKLGFKGVVVSDDLQMGAIAKNYTLRETLKLAINAGENILLFANQLEHTDTKAIIDTIKELIKNKEIKLSSLQKSNKKIDKLLIKLQ